MVVDLHPLPKMHQWKTSNLLSVQRLWREVSPIEAQKMIASATKQLLLHLRHVRDRNGKLQTACSSLCLVHFKKLDNCKSLDIGMDKNSQGVPELWWSKFAQYSLHPFYFLNCILFMVKPEGKCTVYSF